MYPARITRLFVDAQGRVRNGWWMLAFIACVAATRPVYAVVSGALKNSGLDALWREPLGFVFVLLATWFCVRVRRASLTSVGFRLDARWARQFGGGLLVGGGALGAAALLIQATGGVEFSLDPQRSVALLLQGLYVFLFAVLMEEALFRGFLFQRLLAGTNAWVAQLAFAALFALGHANNPGMEGLVMVIASLHLALAALWLGMAYLRTRSLALPIGIHLGWNWVQGSVLGFGVSGLDQHGWLQPAFAGQPEWVTGGAFGPEASVFGLLVASALLFALWRWKGTGVAVPAAPAVPDLSAAAPA